MRIETGSGYSGLADRRWARERQLKLQLNVAEAKIAQLEQELKEAKNA